jgi:hypothetical protein
VRSEKLGISSRKEKMDVAEAVDSLEAADAVDAVDTWDIFKESGGSGSSSGGVLHAVDSSGINAFDTANTNFETVTPGIL